MHFIIQKLKISTLFSKSIQTEKAKSLILTEQEETKTRYFPPKMRVFGEFDQREWPNPIADCRKVENCGKLKEAFLLWPGLFGKPSTSVNTDFESLIGFLEQGCFWNLRMHASPTEFWTLLLSEFTTMTPTLKFLIQATLAVPYGSVAAEVL